MSGPGIPTPDDVARHIATHGRWGQLAKMWICVGPHYEDPNRVCGWRNELVHTSCVVCDTPRPGPGQATP